MTCADDDANITVGAFSLPGLTLPSLNIPAATTPANITVGAFSLPGLTLPSLNIPAATTPANITVGAFSLPGLTLPSLNIPAATTPWPCSSGILAALASRSFPVDRTRSRFYRANAGRWLVLDADLRFRDGLVHLASWPRWPVGRFPLIGRVPDFTGRMPDGGAAVRQRQRGPATDGAAYYPRRLTAGAGGAGGNRRGYSATVGPGAAVRQRQRGPATDGAAYYPRRLTAGAGGAGGNPFTPRSALSSSRASEKRSPSMSRTVLPNIWMRRR